jgi:hypothetical protein
MSNKSGFSGRLSLGPVFSAGSEKIFPAAVVIAVFHGLVHAAGCNGQLAVFSALDPTFFLKIPDMKLQVFLRNPQKLFQFISPYPGIDASRLRAE